MRSLRPLLAWLFVAGFFGGGAVVCAQPRFELGSPRARGNPFLHVWRAEDYGAGAANTCVVQQAVTGFIYVGNSRGVLEFDGARWRLIALPKGGPANALAFDARGRLLIGSDNEIAALETDAVGAPRAVTLLDSVPGTRSFPHIASALAATDGVWFAAAQHIIRLAPDGSRTDWSTTRSFARLWWMEGAMHTTHANDGFARLAPGGEVELIALDPLPDFATGRPNMRQVFAARPEPDGSTLLLTAHGPAHWWPGSRTPELVPSAQPRFVEDSAIAAAFLDDGGMVFAYTRPGVLVCRPDGTPGRFLNHLGGLAASRITNFASDHEGGVWLALRDGVARFQHRSPFARHDNLPGLPGTPVALLRHDGELFLAGGAGLTRRIEPDGHFVPLRGAARDATSLLSAHGRLYAAAAGLAEIRPEDETVHPFSNAPLNALSAFVREPALLLGAGDDGVTLFRSERQNWQPAGRLAALTESADSLLDAGDGFVWGTTPEGRAWRADFRAGAKLDAPVKLFGATEGLPAPPGRVRLFRLGELIVATTASGLLRHDSAADRFVAETRVANLPPGAIETAAAGANGSLWVRLAAPDHRLFRVRADSPARWRAEEFICLPLRPMMITALYDDEDARTLWLAGPDALVSFALDSVRSIEPAPPTVTVRRVLAPDARTLWADGLATRLTLPAEATALRFEFAATTFAPDFSGRTGAAYRTRLEGLDADWTAWSDESARDFTNLASGWHRLRVQARDLAGRPGPETAFAFFVATPWWLQWWALALGAVAVGLLLIGALHFRTRLLLARNATLAAEVAARTSDLVARNAELARLHQLELDEKTAARVGEEKARLEVLRYQLNPHFLYNTLNSVYALALTKPRAAADMVLRLADFCRIALTRRDEGGIAVGAELEKLTLYLDIEKARWGDSLHIEFAVDDAARTAVIPPFLLLPLVENALKYGGLTSPGQLSVRIAVHHAADGALDIEVANSGHWHTPSAGAPNGSTGLGLENLRQRLARYYPDAHAFTTEAKDGWVVARLRLLTPKSKI